MEKVVIMSTDVYTDIEDNNKDELIKALQRLSENGNLICFVSRDTRLLKMIESDIDFARYLSRDRIRKVIQLNADKQNYFVVVGNKDQDFFLANNFKLPLFGPVWTTNIDHRVTEYGNPIVNVEQLEQVIDVLNNQNNWYYTLELPDKSKVYSLISAHYYSSYIPEKERELVKGFEKLLKEGNKTYYDILYTHFIASMSNNSDFRDVDIWAIFPSSGTEFNEDLMQFKEAIRKQMGSKNPPSIKKEGKPNNLFIRHTTIDKSRSLNRNKRRALGCTRHLDTVMLNDAYRDRLEGKTVCVFDDYLTHGNSFETARNLLTSQKVTRMIFVSIGRFDNPYLYQEYKITGDVYTPDFDYELIKEQDIYGGVEEIKARKEVEKLHSIFGL